MPYEVEMAEHFEEIIERNRINLINRMKSENLDVLELELTPWHLTKPTGSDGLHLGSVHKRQLFDKIISYAVDMHRFGPPVLKYRFAPEC